jgi:transcriptional regulator with XRE-family HTH domain
MYPNLRAEMARKNVTQVQLADFLGIRTATLSEKMSGKYPFTFDECLKIKEFLNVDMPVEELFKKAV